MSYAAECVGCAWRDVWNNGRIDWTTSNCWSEVEVAKPSSSNDILPDVIMSL